MRINLGCGLDVLPGWVNIDWSDGLGPDVIPWNLDRLPWPFPDASASEIRGIDIFEHVQNHTGFMVQCHRILAPGGLLTLQTTYWRSKDSYTDPDHTCHPTEHTFHYWIPGNPLYERQNVTKGGVAFEPVKIHPNPVTGQMDVVLRRPA